MKYRMGGYNGSRYITDPAKVEACDKLREEYLKACEHVGADPEIDEYDCGMTPWSEVVGCDGGEGLEEVLIIMNHGEVRHTGVYAEEPYVAHAYHIRSCPFCDAHDLYIEHSDDGCDHSIHCCSCGANGPWDNQEFVAVDLWNYAKRHTTRL